MLSETSLLKVLAREWRPLLQVYDDLTILKGRAACKPGLVLATAKALVRRKLIRTRYVQNPSGMPGQKRWELRLTAAGVKERDLRNREEGYPSLDAGSTLLV